MSQNQSCQPNNHSLAQHQARDGSFGGVPAADSSIAATDLQRWLSTDSVPSQGQQMSYPQLSADELRVQQALEQVQPGLGVKLAARLEAVNSAAVPQRQSDVWLRQKQRQSDMSIRNGRTGEAPSESEVHI